MNRYCITLFFLILSFNHSCAQKRRTIEFDLMKYQNPIKFNNQNDSTIAFVNYVQYGAYDKAKKIYPEIFKVDPSAGIIQFEKEEPYLSALGDYIEDYSNDSYQLLALSVYLKQKYNTRLELYDKMLRESILLDTTNIAAIYLLSQLNYEYGINYDAAYLVLKMKEQKGNNQEIQRLYNFFEPQIEEISKNLPSLTEFMSVDIRYDEEKRIKK